MDVEAIECIVVFVTQSVDAFDNGLVLFLLVVDTPVDVATDLIGLKAGYDNFESPSGLFSFCQLAWISSCPCLRQKVSLRL